MKDLLDEATRAIHIGDQQELERLTLQMAQSSDQNLSFMLQRMQHPNKLEHVIIIKVIRAMGYPRNEAAIPELLYHLGDPNLPGGEDALETLVEMGPNVVVPHLIKALLEPGEPYHKPYPISYRPNNQSTTWASDVEGLCSLLTRIEREYARQCCPAINSILCQVGLSSSTDRSVYPNPDLTALLDVVQWAGGDVSYMLPTFLMLTKNFSGKQYPGYAIGEQARKLVFSFSQEVLASYALLISDL